MPPSCLSDRATEGSPASECRVGHSPLYFQLSVFPLKTSSQRVRPGHMSEMAIPFFFPPLVSWRWPPFLCLRWHSSTRPSPGSWWWSGFRGAQFQGLGEENYICLILSKHSHHYIHSAESYWALNRRPGPRHRGHGSNRGGALPSGTWPNNVGVR